MGQKLHYYCMHGKSGWMHPGSYGVGQAEDSYNLGNIHMGCANFQSS